MFRIEEGKINADPRSLNTVYLSDGRYLYVIHIWWWAGVVNDNAGSVSLLHRELGVQGSHLNQIKRLCHHNSILGSTIRLC
jgi:hypothetical protein